MSIVTKAVSLLALGTALATPRLGHADDREAPTSYAWRSDLRTSFGVAAVFGGGVMGFTDKTMRAAQSSPVGGLWDLRVTLGSHTPLACDITYLGTATGVKAMTGGNTGTLVGTTVEGALRYNILPHYAWNPYAFVGVGWQHYDVSGAGFSLAQAGMNPNDTITEYPMGVGIAYRDRSGLVLDARGTFRASADAGLVEEKQGGPYAPMHSWEASAALGYEF